MSTNNIAQHSRIRSLLIQVVLLSLILLLAPHQQGQAASTIYVNSTLDVAKNDGMCTLREAVIAANRDRRSGGKPNECIAGSGADTIMLPAGTYTITRSDNGNEDSSSTGDLDILDDLTILGDGADTTTIVGIDITDRIVHVLNGNIAISGVTISGGNVPQSGGGIYNEATLSLTDVFITENHAQENIGGVMNDGALVMDRSTVANNTAVLAPYELSNNGTATLTNSTVSGQGLSSNGTTDLNFVTVVGGTAVSSGTLNSYNSILTACSGNITSQGYNLISDTTDCTISGDLTGNITDQNALLDVLADNGGTTPTHAHLEGSPAIEAGSNNNCPAADQRGITRPVGLTCDIGSYENENPVQNGTTVIVTTDEDSDDGECTYLHCTLREAINAANSTADTIEFNISGTAPFIIQPLSPLPTLTQPVTLDGTTQPGGEVTIDGSLAGMGADGLTLAGDNSFIRGLIITNFGCTGIVLQSSNNLIEENTITNNGCHGVQVLSGTGNTIQNNSIVDNGLLGIDLADNDTTPNDIGDGDSGANGLQNFPLLTNVVKNGTTTSVKGRLNSTADTTFALEFFSNNNCDIDEFGEGETSLGIIQVTTNAAGHALINDSLTAVVENGQFVSATATDADGNTSEFSHCVVVSPNNTIWPNALDLNVVPDMSPTAVDHHLDQLGQSRWYKLTVQPNSRLNVTLSNLPANFDVTVYKDIGAAFNTLLTTEDLVHLSAEFAPNAFNPDSLAPDAFSSDAFAPDAFLPDAFLPDAFLPDAYSPDAFLPDAFLPDAYSPDAFLPDAFLPDAFLPDAFLPDAFLPDAFLPDAFLPDAFLSAQTRSLVAISAFNSTADEYVSLNTWLNDGEYYIRVRGRQGAYSLATPFHLEVQLLSGGCSHVAPITTASSTIPTAGNFKTLILTDLARMTGGSSDETALIANLEALKMRGEVMGEIIDVGLDAKVADANLQADMDGTNGNPNNQGCPYAKNLVVEAIKEIIDGYRALNPDLAYIIVVGNDEVIPFQRYPDHALLANEKNYVVPVDPDTHSESSLRLGYILTQDGYGSAIDISLKTNQFPIPNLPVGRLVETMADVNILLSAYLGTSNGTVDTPDQIAVTGYDFIEDAAQAVKNELEAGTGVTADSLILDGDLSPKDPLAWTADDLAPLLLGNRHDLTFLAGHFSANSMLAADYDTRLTTDDLVASSVDFTNSIIFSLGCHAGYNIVNEHGVPDVTNILDWPQAFTQKGATLIASTGFAYGHTDFLKYSERLHLLFSQQLRTGTGAVSIGEAMLAAKQTYLATTPELRGIDEKSLLAATIYGLPMLSVDMPGARLTPTSDSSIVNSTNSFADDPGATLGLTYADVTLNPSLTLNNIPLTDVTDGTTQVIASYLSGSAGVMTNPSEVVLPLEMVNVDVDNTVLRGVGFRGGSYSDLAGIVPLTGAPVTEIRGVHTPFLTNVFYPIRLWQVNYFDLLTNPTAGQTRLVVTPAQFQSDSFGAQTGTMREYSSMDFRLYYSSNIQSYNGSVPALSAGPTIAQVTTTAVPSTDSLHIEAIITGNPAAGVQEAWAVYTDGNGMWLPLDLIQNSTDSRLWEGVLDLDGADAEAFNFIVQAVNGVGLVSMDSNQGGYHRLGVEVPGTADTTLTLDLPTPDGDYSTVGTFSAILTSDGSPVANQPVFISLGSQARLGITDGNGRATVEIPLLSLPDTYEVHANFAGADPFLPSADTASFTINKHPTTLTFDPVSASGETTESHLMEVSLSAGARRLTEKTVFLVVTGSGGSLSRALITDNEGKVVLGDLNLPAGTYSVIAYFSGSITLHNGEMLELDDERYLATTASGTLTILNTPPQSADDAYSTDEDVDLVMSAPGVLDNDNDVNGDGLTAVLVTNPTHGTVSLNGDGSFTYNPDDDYNGADSFIYRADDGEDVGNLATVTITINPVNDAPVADDDSYSVVTGNMLSVSASDGVLDNDSDVDGDGLTAVLVTNPNDGTLILNSDGSFDYTPDAGFIGMDSFTYTANDGQLDSNVATVTITILPANTAPDCSAATTTVTFIWPPDKRFVPVNIIDVTDADGDPITITIDEIHQDEPVGRGNNAPDGMGIGTDTAQVRAERAGNGDGRVYHLTFTASDGQGGSCSDTIRLPVVDHDQSNEEIDSIDGGPLYDSTQPD